MRALGLNALSQALPGGAAGPLTAEQSELWQQAWQEGWAAGQAQAKGWLGLGLVVVGSIALLAFIRRTSRAGK
jgi:hypothetical protein